MDSFGLTVFAFDSDMMNRKTIARKLLEALIVTRVTYRQVLRAMDEIGDRREPIILYKALLP